MGLILPPPYPYSSLTTAFSVLYSSNQMFCSLFQYLDCMFDWNPKYGSEFGFHERQVELYAKYDKDKLLLFLRSCNDIPLQKVRHLRV